MQEYKEREQNIACAAAIDAAVGKHHDGMHFRFRKAFEDIAQQYDMERIGHVLCNTISLMNYDGRFSDKNKAWAAQHPIADEYSREYFLRSHPVLLDRLTQHYREQEQREPVKSSIDKDVDKTGKESTKRKSSRAGMSR